MVRSSEVWFGLVAMKGHSFGCLLLEVLWWLRIPQLVAGLTIPRVVSGAQGPLEINMRKKGELTGSYSLRVLVISEWDSLRGVRCVRLRKTKMASFLDSSLDSTRAATQGALLFFPLPNRVYSGST